MRKAQDIIRTRDPELSTFNDRLDADLESLRRISVLSTAIETGILSHLQEPKEIQTLSEETGYDFIILELFLEALSQMGTIEHVSEGYVISSFTRSYLIKDSPFDQTTHILNMLRRVSDWKDLSNILKNGPVKKDRSSKFNKDWMEGIAQSSMDGQIGELITLCAEHIDLKSCKRFLDLGGGHGLYSIAFSALYPNLECTVFDLPSIIDFTNANIQDYDSSVNTIAGDYFSDKIPMNQDIILSSFSRCGSDPEMIVKIRDALSDYGFLIIRRHRGLVSENPLENLEWNLATIEGRKKGTKKWEFGTSPAVEEYLEALKVNGFSILRHQIFDSISEVIIARKEDK